MTRSIASVEILQLRLPLTTPYRLAFGTQYHFDTIIAVVTSSDGAEGFGEATLLHGYTDETVEQSWQSANRIAPDLIGCSCDAARETLHRHIPESAFTASAFLTALDMLDVHPALAAKESVELLAILSSKGDDLGAAQVEIDALVEKGYRTLKFKVGFDVEQDLQNLANIQRANDGRAKLRVDANQGFSAEQAIAFLDAMSPDGIELLEQPCDKGDWSAAAQIKPYARVPLMLDESIYGLADIERAVSEKLCEFIKLKLMKLGDLSSLTSALDRISALGMKPVLGNGVAADVGCWMEACAVPGHVSNAGEMNGFLKTPAQLMDPPLEMSGAHVILPEAMPKLNRDVATEALVQRQAFGC